VVEQLAAGILHDHLAHVGLQVYLQEGEDEYHQQNGKQQADQGAEPRKIVLADDPYLLLRQGAKVRLRDRRRDGTDVEQLWMIGDHLPDVGFFPISSNNVEVLFQQDSCLP